MNGQFKWNIIFHLLIFIIDGWWGLFENRPVYFLVGSHESAQEDLDLRGRSRISWADRTPLTTIHYLSSSSPRFIHDCSKFHFSLALPSLPSWQINWIWIFGLQIRECHSCDRSLSVMANQQQVDSRPWILDLVPFIVVILIAAHVLALVLQSQLQPLFSFFFFPFY